MFCVFFLLSSDVYCNVILSRASSGTILSCNWRYLITVYCQLTYFHEPATRDSQTKLRTGVVGQTVHWRMLSDISSTPWVVQSRNRTRACCMHGVWNLRQGQLVLKATHLCCIPIVHHWEDLAPHCRQLQRDNHSQLISVSLLIISDMPSRKSGRGGKKIPALFLTRSPNPALARWDDSQALTIVGCTCFLLG